MVRSFIPHPHVPLLSSPTAITRSSSPLSPLCLSSSPPSPSSHAPFPHRQPGRDGKRRGVHRHALLPCCCRATPLLCPSAVTGPLLCAYAVVSPLLPCCRRPWRPHTHLLPSGGRGPPRRPTTLGTSLAGHRVTVLAPPPRPSTTARRQPGRQGPTSCHSPRALASAPSTGRSRPPPLLLLLLAGHRVAVLALRHGVLQK